jgi:protein-S-isoprenylcysteine O-methyltransferase Ste14
VPLSEHEQRLLEQLERALQDEDPKFASALQGSRLRGRLRLRLFTAVVGVLLGLAAIGYGVSSHRVALEVVGSVVVLGCGWLCWSSWRRMPAPGEIVPATKLRKLRRARNRSAKTQGTFMQRLELRWQHRRERDQF